MVQYQIIALVLFVAVAIKEGLAFQCVQCNSYEDTDCNSNPQVHLKDCVGRFENATACRKMEQEIYYEDDYHTRTVRQCAVEVGPFECKERTGTYRFKTWYCHCPDEGCNSAGMVSVSIVATSLAAVAAFLFKL